MSGPGGQAIWLFDSVCVLCSRGVQYTLRHEKAASIRFVAIQSDEGRVLAQRHGIDPDDPDSFLFVQDGAALVQSDAVIALARHLNGPACLIPFFRFIPRRLRDAAYRVVARHRYALFGKMDQCLMPTAAQRDRFVL